MLLMILGGLVGRIGMRDAQVSLGQQLTGGTNKGSVHLTRK